MLRSRKLCLILAVVLAFALLTACAPLSKRPADRGGYAAYPTVMVQADQDLQAARAAGKDRECPDEFNAAKATVDKSFEVYMTCRDEDAIALAKKAIDMIKALCPQKYVAPPPPPPPAKEPVVLKDINFDFDKATLTNAAIGILRSNIKVLKANPGVAVRIEGHTCAHGADDYNMRLGDRRAGAVKEFMVKEGKISESRMSTISYGETRLLMPETPTPKNKDSKEAKANRRVHFEVVGQ